MMTSYTDLELIDNYQKTQDEKIYTEIFNRYQFFLYKNSSRIYKTFYLDKSLEHEDIHQELHISLLNTINRVKINKIKDINKFRLSTLLKHSISNYEVVLRNNPSFTESLISDRITKRVFIKRYSSKIEPAFSELSIFTKQMNTFIKENLTEKEGEIFTLYLEGYRQCVIAKKINRTPALITHYMRIIKKKFKIYLNIC